VIRGLLSGNGVHRDLQQQASAMFSEVISRVWEDAMVDFAFIECKDSEASRRVVSHFNKRPMGNEVVLRGMSCSARAPMRSLTRRRSSVDAHGRAPPTFFGHCLHCVVMPDTCPCCDVVQPSYASR
jgi:hypothetical protein